MISIDISPFSNGCHAKVEGLLTPETFVTLKDWVGALSSFGQEQFVDASDLVCTSHSICSELLELFEELELQLAHPLAID